MRTNDNAVRCLLDGIQNQFFRRWQGSPNTINTLAHLFKLPSLTSFRTSTCTESAEDPIQVQRDRWHGWLWGLAAGTAGSFLLGYGMARFTDAALPPIDSALTAFSLVAQWWSTRKYIVNWVLWIAVDVVYTAVFAYKQLYLTAGLYAFFVLLAVWGLQAWRKALVEQGEASDPSVTMDPMIS